MFNYPEKVLLKQLEQTNAEYQELQPALNDIHLLYSGGYKLKNRLKEYLPQRPGEESEVYKSRLNKFLYINVLASAINSQTSKLENSNLDVVTPEGDIQFWERFREGTDASSQRSEKELVTQIFRECLKFKKAFLHVEKPYSEIKPQNRLHEDLLNLKPYINLYPADQVTDYELESPIQPKWVKLRQISEVKLSPLEEPVTKVTWTFIDKLSIAKYSCFAKLKSDNNIASILINGEYAPVSEETAISLDSNPIQHNFGTCPIILAELSSDLWVCDQVVNIALAHLRVSCHKHDLETFLYVQRQWKQQLVPDDPSKSYEDNPPPPTGLQYVLQGGDFDWKEAEGKILPQLESSLSQLEEQVRSLINQGGASGSSKGKGALEQSGLSKTLDYQEQEEILKKYGTLLTDILQNVYRLVAKSNGSSDEVYVSGLDNFAKDSAEELITNLTALSSLDIQSLKQKLPPTLFEITYSKLCNLLISNLSASQKAEIEKEISTITLPTGQGINPDNFTAK